MKKIFIILIIIFYSKISYSQWAVIMSKGTDYSATLLRTSTNYPSSAINEYWNKNYRITDIAYGDEKWLLSMAANSSYTTQSWKKNNTFPVSWIEEKWHENFRITSIAYGEDSWVIVMSKSSDYTAQIWRMKKYFPAQEIKEFWDKKYRITSLTYGNGNWLLVMSKGVQLGDATYIKTTNYPKDEIKKYWGKGYQIANLTYGNGSWVVNMRKKTKYTTQSWILNNSIPHSLIEDKKSNNYQITSFFYGKSSKNIKQKEKLTIIANCQEPKTEKKHKDLIIKAVKLSSKYTILQINNLNVDNVFCINPKAYIKDNFTHYKYKLIKTEGIPVCNNNQKYKALSFNLYFEKIPQTTNSIDIIQPIKSEESTSFSNVKLCFNNDQKGLPPIIKIEKIILSKNILKANDTMTLSVTLKNIGPGDAKKVNVYVNNDICPQIKYPKIMGVPIIPANGGEKTINITIKGEMELPTSEVVLKLEVMEPNFKIKIKGKKITIPTKEFDKPKLILAKYTVMENKAANSNNKIDINEIIDLKFIVQNVGEGDATQIKVYVENKQKGVMLLGVVNNNAIIRKNPVYNQIKVGKYKTINYRYFVNSEFSDKELNFIIKVKENKDKYGFEEEVNFPINKEIEEIGDIVKINSKEQERTNTKIEDLPDLENNGEIIDNTVDIDKNIPQTNIKNLNTYVLIVGNEDYTKYQTGLNSESNVDFAKRDAQIFNQYCINTLGIPKENIRIRIDAISSMMERDIKWIANKAKYDKNAKLIFYYSGHGFPNKNKESCIVPVDITADDIINMEKGIKLSTLYASLSANNPQNVIIFLDACFSGGGRNKGLIAAKAMRINPQKEDINSTKMVVFASSSGNQESLFYKEKKHGIFTYFLIKKIQQTKGETTFGEMFDFLKNKIPSKTEDLYDKTQSPKVNISPNLKENSWKSWSFKP